MAVKTAVLLVAYFGSYGLILSGWPSLLGLWCLCVVMGVALAGLGFCVCHDALHGAYSADRRVNRTLGVVFDMIGANGYMWRITHNRLHHVYTNVRGYDEDVDVSPLLRLSPHAPHKPMHRYQHVYAYVAYAFSTVFWVFAKDYGYFLKRDLGPYRDMRHPRSAWTFLILSKLAYYVAMIVLPLLVLDVAWWQFAIGFLTVHLVGGLILGVIFQLAHVVEPTWHVAGNDAGSIKGAWMEHQMRATNDFAQNNRVLSWYLGGINFQVEHHLFPKICHVHYPAISPIVERVARRHGIPYNTCDSLWSAIGSHHRMLKQLGEPVGST
ncbi:fatty acid desaturase family protein [Marinivivus vitaminiproducens]|uniref:fatty acid desaturase family protein n=1 Tax=Marinivivus vitaminiproducens TaxID=3035935 RepID=UPI0027A032EF|nr:acyl-CoA desaturase [Geminicoccaceae bacterium SCSIO 64248]